MGAIIVESLLGSEQISQALAEEFVQFVQLDAQSRAVIITSFIPNGTAASVVKFIVAVDAL